MFICVCTYTLYTLVWVIADVWGEFSYVSILSGLPITFEGRE